jgi:hypothetical protein
MTSLDARMVLENSRFHIAQIWPLQRGIEIILCEWPIPAHIEWRLVLDDYFAIATICKASAIVGFLFSCTKRKK